MRLIDADALLNRIPNPYEQAQVARWVNEEPTVSVEPQWIPCSERLPTKKTEVIYSLENHYVSTGYMTDRDYNGDEMELHWEDMESGALIYPEAWMPLPEPYKGDDK